jgi:myo-inositol-1(or 4)-monophosphatase
MDRAAEALIRDVISSRRPHDAVVGEEDGGRADPDGVTWWVDPIDGTTNYVYDHPGYAVSVAAWLGGSPLVGVVEDPTHHRTYWATAGGGAWCNGVELRIGEPPPLEQMLVATGFGYDRQRRMAQGRVAAELLGRVRDLRRMGAAALDLCSVAAHRVDGYYEAGLSRWDVAAGQLVATEAGAAVEAIEGGPAHPGSVLACHPARIGELRELLLDCGAGDGEPGGSPATSARS